jgi:hypothetical protein
MLLFRGLDTAYGIYKLASTTKRSDGKIKGEAATIKKPVTRELWQKHLDGKAGLGIIPITERSTVYFGAIDVDVYMGLEMLEIVKKIELFNVPLVPCRSKSGGCHLYLFTQDEVTAADMQHKLKEVAAALGYGDCEIYPRQTEILSDRGDIGQWLNMPYFDNVRGGRYCIKSNGDHMSMTEFLDYAEAARLSIEKFNDLQVKLTDDLTDGPPCLQHLITQGFPEGTRNDGLFNLGVYARMSSPDTWKHELEVLNNKYMNPPLKSAEIQGLFKSLNKKEYMYTCNKSPIKPHCNSVICRTRRFGVGNNGGLPVMSNLTKYNTNPPIWFVDVENSRMELMTEDLQSQTRFQKRCMEALNIMPPQVTRTAWQTVIQHLMDNVQIIEASADSSTQGQLLELLERFCTQKAQANVIDEVLLGRPMTKDGKHSFRLSDFMGYLERHHFREYKVHQVTSILRAIGGEHQFSNIKGRGINFWVIPEFGVQTTGHALPNMGKEVPY